MNIFLFCYVFFFGNTKSIKSNYKLALTNDDNNDNKNQSMYHKSNTVYISKNYILDLINNYYDNNEIEFTDDNIKFTDENIDYENINKANNIVDKNTKSPIMQGINYAYPYEDQDKNNKILNDINKNLYLQKQKNILIDNKISNNIKLKIADKYLTMNTTKYKININTGGLYNDWLFNFE